MDDGGSKIYESGESKPPFIPWAFLQTTNLWYRVRRIRMKRFKQIAVVVLANLVLLFFLFEFNSFLSPWGLYMTIGGLFVVFPALKLPFEQGFIAVFFTGLCWDALTPVPFGFFAFLMSALCVGIYQMRHRLRSQRKFYIVLAAFVANVLIIVVCWLLWGSLWFHWDALARFSLELMLSQLLVVLLGFWFIELQENALFLMGGTPTADELSG